MWQCENTQTSILEDSQYIEEIRQVDFQKSTKTEKGETRETVPTMCAQKLHYTHI